MNDPSSGSHPWQPSAARTSLTVVMPAYNEEALIEPAVNEVFECVLAAVPGSNLLVVDDGSQDATGAILDRLSKADSRLLVIHQPNGGHGRALLAGLQAANAAWILLIDSDRQIPLDCFAGAWESRSGKDGVLGIRTARRDPLVRQLITRILRLALRALLGVKLIDPNVPFKLLRREAIDEALRLMPGDTLIPSVFLAAFVARRRLPVTFLPIAYRQRQAGQGWLRRWKLFQFAFEAFLQLAAYSIHLRGQSNSAASTAADRAA